MHTEPDMIQLKGKVWYIGPGSRLFPLLLKWTIEMSLSNDYRPVSCSIL